MKFRRIAILYSIATHQGYTLSVARAVFRT
jgi:hypothetical protein